MFIDANSWKSNFAAYGMWICEILVLFLQGLHSKDCVVILLSKVNTNSKQTFGYGNLRNRSHKPTDVTHMDSKSIRNLEQPLLQERGRSVRDHTITFHFSET